MMPNRWPVLSPVEACPELCRRGADPTNETGSRQAGFSLVEMLITSLILTIVLFAIYSMYQTNMSTATWGNKKTDLQQNARVALDMMRREIRMAGYDPSNTGCMSLNPAPADCTASNALTPTDLTFIADIDPDADNGTEKVQYTYNAGPQTIIRMLWQPWNTANPITEVVADSVSNLTFTYCKADNTCPAPSPAPADVRRITISITASGQAGSKTPSFTFASDARLETCRNVCILEGGG